MVHTIAIEASQNSTTGNVTSQQQPQLSGLNSETFNGTSNKTLDFEMMQNMMQLYHQRLYSQPAFQPMLSAANPLDLLTLMNYSMVAPPFMLNPHSSTGIICILTTVMTQQ